MTNDAEEVTRLDQIRKAIRSFLADGPPRYGSTKNRLMRLNSVVREETAIAFQPVLKEHAHRIPHASYDEKKDFALWINAELVQLGLAFRCPKTGLPTYLQANPGHTPDVGRFRLEYVDEDHHRRNSFTTVELPEFSLMPETTKLSRKRPRSGPSR